MAPRAAGPFPLLVRSLAVIVLCCLWPAPVRALTPVTLQLKWKHQFQFAGYYAAVKKGYFRDAGLDVRLEAGRPGLRVADELAAGRADFGVDMPSILIARHQGKPVVALAAIFQHSPVALFVRADSGITNPQDLRGKTVMLRPGGNIEIRAMLAAEGIDKKQIDIIPHSWNLDDLIDGTVDAQAGYLTDRPFLLRQRGVAFTVLRPLTYGIDFYGDCLFTTEDEIARHPQRVRAFLAASIKGWQYAMNHQEELVDYILATYGDRLSREALLFEARAMDELMQPKFIEIGHMNPGRWRHIADTLASQGLLPANMNLTGFLYQPQRPGAWIKPTLYALVALLAAITLAGGLLLIFVRKLKIEVARRTSELEDERRFTNAVLATLPGIFYVYEDGKRLIRWNDNFQRESGFSAEEMHGRHPLDWVTEEDKGELIRALAHLRIEAQTAVEVNIQFKDRAVPYYCTGSLLTMGGREYLVGVGIDLSARRHLEAQLRQAQKMESIGRLAGGVAHDFNNILTTILGYCEILQETLPADSKEREYVGIIQGAGDRAATLTRQLLAFSRKQALEKKIISLNRVITDLLKILGKMLGEDVRIDTRLQAAPDIIEADPGQIEQVIMNLAVNARDAMPAGGTIIIETARVETGKGEEAPVSDLSPGDYVLLVVSDTGEGMDKETISRIFDPFFTTKEQGKGTGLGLATVYGIVSRHRGGVHVYSEPGTGTTFRIYLPSSPSLEEIAADPDAALPLPRGTETILVVDDEATVRRLVIDTLHPLGYTCLEAANGAAALGVAAAHEGTIDLLFTDVVMPEMGGTELAARLTTQRPGLRVLFMSGYTEKALDEHRIVGTEIDSLTKPVTPRTVAVKIRELLDRGKE